MLQSLCVAETEAVAGRTKVGSRLAEWYVQYGVTMLLYGGILRFSSLSGGALRFKACSE
jgi:hypothetical protein